MSRREQGTLQELDWALVFIYLGLVGVGWMMIYAVGYDSSNPGIFNFSKNYGKQLIWIFMSLGLGALTLIVDSRFYRSFAYPMYAGAIGLLVLVLLFGQEVAGSKSWFNIGFFKFQPSEITKMATCLALAYFLSPQKIKLDEYKNQLYAMGIIFLPMALIVYQGDTGSALVYSSLLLVLFRNGMPLPLYIIGLSLAVLSIVALLFPPLPILFSMILIACGVLIRPLKINWLWAGLAGLAVIGYGLIIEKNPIPALILGTTCFAALAIFLALNKKQQLSIVMSASVVISGAYTFTVNYIFYNILRPHQQDRVLAWLRPNLCDPLGTLYNVTQSKLAIGSGGLSGRGFLHGTLTKLHYVPEQSTDFIFCTVGEEQGFIGVALLLGLYVALLLRIIQIAERQRSKFSQLYAYGVASILFFHFFVNIGMTIGLVPIIGIPLPYISYGGSSLISFTILLFILLKMDSHRLLVFR